MTIRGSRDYGLVTRKEIRRDTVRAARNAGVVRNGRPLNWSVHSCPTDDYKKGALFSWIDLQRGIVGGIWIDGMVFKHSTGKLRRVESGKLVEVDR